MEDFRFQIVHDFVIAQIVRLIQLIWKVSCILLACANMIQQVCLIFARILLFKYMFNRIVFVHDLLYHNLYCWELNWHSNALNNKNIRSRRVQINTIFSLANYQI